MDSSSSSTSWRSPFIESNRSSCEPLAIRFDERLAF
jgi:hypothetical protein